jgi:hypothetical protein
LRESVSQSWTTGGNDVPVNSHVDDVMKRLYLRRVFLLRAKLPELEYPSMSTNEDVIMKFLSPLLPRTQNNGFQPPFSEFKMQTQIQKAYADLKDLINGTSVVASIVGTVEKPVEFFLSRYQDQSLTSADRQLSLLAMRAL